MSKQYQITISVYQHSALSGQLLQIMSFNEEAGLPCLSVLYAGGVHYDYITRAHTNQNPAPTSTRVDVSDSGIVNLSNVPPLTICDSSDDDDEPPRPHAKSLSSSNISANSGKTSPLTSCDSSDDDDEPSRHHVKPPPPNISVIKTKIHSAAVQNALRNSTQASAKHQNRQHRLLEQRLSIQLNGKLYPISGDGHSVFRCIAKRIKT